MWFACPQPCPHPISFYCSATLSLQPHWLPGFSCCISGHYTRHSCHLEHSFSKELNGQFPRFPQDSAQMWLSPWRLLWSQLQLQTCPPPTILSIPLPCLVFFSKYISLSDTRCISFNDFIYCLTLPNRVKTRGGRDFCPVCQKCISGSTNSIWPYSGCSINE